MHKLKKNSTFIIGEHVYYRVFFIFVPFHLLKAAEPGDKLDKELPFQVAAHLVEDEEFPKWIRLDEGLDLRLQT